MGSFRESIHRRLSSLTKGKTPDNSADASQGTTPNSSSTLNSKSDLEVKRHASTKNTMDMAALNKTLSNTPTGDKSSASEAGAYERDFPLFNMDLLAIPQSDRVWFKAVNVAVRAFMNELDASHNYQHIRRVVSNAKILLKKEKKHHQWARDIDPIIVWVACMTHDVGDSKYGTIGEDRDQNAIIDDLLAALDCPLPIRRQAAYLASQVSFTAEMQDKRGMKDFAAAYPAFKIIQDAVHLDELGAVGVGRLFIYRGIDEARRESLIDSDIKFIHDRFGHYPALMKTKTSRAMAEERYAWMTDEFFPLLEKQTDTSNV